MYFVSWMLGRNRQVALLICSLLLHCSLAWAGFWSTAYYPGYEQGSMPASAIDFAALTHIIHFSVIPNTDGTLNTTGNGITTAYSTDLVSRAHAAGKQVLICVGGAS